MKQAINIKKIKLIRTLALKKTMPPRKVLASLTLENSKVIQEEKSGSNLLIPT